MVKELQCFLGFTNIYRQFIHRFSSVAAPLTNLLRGGKKGAASIYGGSTKSL